MPGLDRTGPGGLGPMTGGSRGLCNPRGMALGRRCFGLRQSFAHPYRYDWGYRTPPRFTPQQELDGLKSEAQALRDELAHIEAEIGRISTREEKE